MIEEIKKIKISEYKKKFATTIEENQKELEELEKLQSEYTEEKMKQMDAEIAELSRKANSFLVKYFNFSKRRELNTQISDIYKLRPNLFKIEVDIKSLKNKINDIEYNILQYEKDMADLDLQQLGFDFERACDFLRQHGFEPVLTNDDQKYLKYENNNYQSHLNGTENGIDKMKDYVLVHKTSFYPKDGKIRTDKELGLKNDAFLSLDRIGSIKFSEQRNTIHFAVNGEVGSHAYGNWDDSEYAVIIPFANMPVNQLKSGNVVDTFIENGLNLPKDTIILCPKEKVEEVRSYNANINVLGYDGTNVMNYANTLVGMLGYAPESSGMWSWTNDSDAQKFYNNLKESNLNMYTGPHLQSLEQVTESQMNCVMTFESLLEKILCENIVLTNEETISLINNKKIELVSESYGLELQPKIFGELISFLNKYGIIINNDVLEKVMFYINNHKDSKNDYDIFKKNALEQGYNSDYHYVNSLLIGDILNQVKEKVCTQSEQKSR